MTAVVLGAGLFVVSFLALADGLWGALQIRWLKRISPRGLTSYPAVAIIIPARNEEAKIAEALSSVLALDYPDKEVVVVDDRSTDATGEVLERLATQHPQLRVLHVTSLPVGWLGKVHALQMGLAATDAPVVLLTDADIVFERDTLKRAIQYLESRPLDHLAMLPEIRVPGVLLNLCVGVFGVYFGLVYRPWKASDPGSTRFIGIGGFNLVRRAALVQAGGLARIALRPDDDLQLGRMLKQSGCRQELVWGLGAAHVEWYSSLRQFAEGLEKNLFAGFGYSLPAAILGSLAVFLLNVWPVIGMALSEGPARALFAATCATWMLAFVSSSHRTGQWPWLAVLFPFGAVLQLCVTANAVFRTVRDGGIHWRGTFYSLNELRSPKS
jgi:hypothetical protein